MCGWLVSGVSVCLVMVCYVILQGYDKGRKQLVISTCANQDPLQATTGNSVSLFHVASDL